MSTFVTTKLLDTKKYSSLIFPSSFIPNIEALMILALFLWNSSSVFEATSATTLDLSSLQVSPTKSQTLKIFFKDS